MKLIDRIKKALAGFLRDELLEYIGYNHNLPFMPLETRYQVENIPFETVVMERVISLDTIERDPYVYEQEVENMRKQFANNLLDHIHVDTHNLVTREDFGQRSIRCVLRVQAKKQ